MDENQKRQWLLVVADLIDHNTANAAGPRGPFETVRVESCGLDLCRALCDRSDFYGISITESTDDVALTFKTAREAKGSGRAVIFVSSQVFTALQANASALKSKFMEFVPELESRDNSRVIVVFEIPLNIVPPQAFYEQVKFAMPPAGSGLSWSP